MTRRLPSWLLAVLLATPLLGLTAWIARGALVGPSRAPTAADAGWGLLKAPWTIHAVSPARGVASSTASSQEGKRRVIGPLALSEARPPRPF